MDPTLDHLFVVFLRPAPADPGRPETAERPLAACASYREARQLRLTLAADCVIRFVGPTGGGD